MRKAAAIILLSLSLAGMFLAGSWYSRHTVDNNGSTDGRKVLYYVDPMNPSHTSDKPGLAPCGMPMEPVYADEGNSGDTLLLPGTVKISPEKQQLLGVRLSQVEKTSRTHALRTIGRVAPDETKVHRLIAGAPGFICDLSEVTTDSYVKKDQWLASFSSPDSIPSIQAYILGLNAIDSMRQNNSERSAESLLGGATYLLRVEKMQDLGISRIQRDEIEKTRTVPQKIKIFSPIDGFVLARNISPDQKFDRGEEWYRVADLSRVWIVADVFEREAQFIRPGMNARVSLPHRGKIFDATVAHVPPQFDSAARTLKVRLEMDNPENVLRPDMFVDVDFLIPLPSAITVPADAVLDSGLRKTVFVDLDNGYFEPRSVETGWRFGDEVEILKGLEPGEKIVVSGNFLVDSESRMKLAAAGMHSPPVPDPVCGLNVDPGKAKADGLQAEHGGKSYSFCSDQCKWKFEEDPQYYVDNPPGVQPSLADIEKKKGVGFFKCMICDMYEQEARAEARNFKSEYKGKTYYFCSDWCRKEFEKAPERYLEKEEGGVEHGSHVGASHD